MPYPRDTTGKLPHVYFGRGEGDALMYPLRYVAFGAGETAPVAREIPRRVGDDPEPRPGRTRRPVG